MSKLTKSDVYIDPVLSNFAVAYSNPAYVAEIILPNFKVSKDTGKYFTFDKTKFRVENSYRAMGDPAREISHSMAAQGTYSINEYALKEFVPDKLVDQADQPIDPEMDATEVVLEKLLVTKELSLATTLADTGTITQNTTLSGTSQWSDYTNSDPFSNINTAKSTVFGSTLKKPNILLLGKTVFDKLVDHPDIVDRIKYSQLGVTTQELLARLFDVEQVLIGAAYYNSAKEGQTDVIASIWGKHAWLIYADKNPGARKVTLGYHFVSDPKQVSKYKPEGRKGIFVEVSESYDQKLVATSAAYLIKNAVA